MHGIADPSPSGPVYVDAQIFIDSVEKHPTYAPALRPPWEAVAGGDLEVVSSELTLLETLIGPLKRGDVALEADYENFYLSPGVRLLPISLPGLRVGARHRATLSRLRTPDALHAAAATLTSDRSGRVGSDRVRLESLTYTDGSGDVSLTDTAGSATIGAVG